MDILKIFGIEIKSYKKPKPKKIVCYRCGEEQQIRSIDKSKVEVEPCQKCIFAAEAFGRRTINGMF